MANKFKTSGGVRLTRALFYETTLADKSTVVYTLKEEDHEGYPSLYRLYMAVADPTEYQFALQYMDSWSHWEMLCESTWFKPYISAWRKELELKLRSAALRAIKATAEAEGKEALSANKYLLEWNKTVTGAVKKAKATEVADRIQASQEASEARRIQDDMSRLLTPSAPNKDLN